MQKCMRAERGNARRQSQGADDFSKVPLQVTGPAEGIHTMLKGGRKQFIKAVNPACTGGEGVG